MTCRYIQSKSNVKVPKTRWLMCWTTGGWSEYTSHFLQPRVAKIRGSHFRLHRGASTCGRALAGAATCAPQSFLRDWLTATCDCHKSLVVSQRVTKRRHKTRCLWRGWEIERHSYRHFEPNLLEKTSPPLKSELWDLLNKSFNRRKLSAGSWLDSCVNFP